jgi:hypothetical protein
MLSFNRLLRLPLPILAFVCSIASLAHAQSAEQALQPFHKIVVSPKINVVLTQGPQESVRLEYQNLPPDQINCVVKGKTLRLYLDDAKKKEPQDKWMKHGKAYKRARYKDAKVTAYVTYRELNALQVRGEEKLKCDSPLISKKFKLKMYGESEVSLTALETDYFKAVLYGENHLRVHSGKAQTQRYRLFGENQVDAERLKCRNLYTSSFGESKLNVYASRRLNVMTFGESIITYRGKARFRKSLVLGESSITHVKKLKH